ncbi:hypothetical protein SAY87_021682 [Trapa incisa]|uniref:Target of Myb protein 1-like n=1 Tax=Trapa incisa TaxID=236973 RepID=A0AAN7PS18_9MYRT|nr:hypothetical protein SAY87_021682 [Trapa incisa]
MMMMTMPTSSATVRVEKATSDLLMNPDWAMNLDICDYINSYPGQAREFIKAVKRRLQHKNPKVQFLALTLLETMVKNCGDYIHFQIAEKNIPSEMVKIVKKKADICVRDKVLLLLDAWQEAFGGPGGKHPQYYYAYEELKRLGIQFPRRSPDSAPIFTPPVTHPHMQAGYGMPSNSSRRLDEAMATEIEGLSMSTIDSMRDVVNLLSDMLQAVNPRDHNAVKDEVIVDLVARCQSNQRMLMQMLTMTGDEELLARGLELNDNTQTVLVKHDAIASGSPLPSQIMDHSSQPTERRGSNTEEKKLKKENGISPRDNVASPSVPPVTIKRNFYNEEEEEEEDDFAQLARRHSKSQSAPTGQSIGGTADPWPVKSEGSPSASSHETPSTCKAIVLSEPPAPVKASSKEQDMIDLLSLALTTTSTPSPETPQPSYTTQNVGAMSNDPSQSNSRAAEGQLSYSSYVVPWAQPQSYPQQPPQAQIQPQPPRPQYPQYSPQQVQPQPQSLPQQYIPPPWASTPGYLNAWSTSNTFLMPRAEASGSSMPFQETRPPQHLNSFPARGMNGSTIPPVDQRTVNTAGQKTFIPSYRLFEDLNVLGKTGASSGLSGSTGQSMIGGRR